MPLKKIEHTSAHEDCILCRAVFDAGAIKIEKTCRFATNNFVVMPTLGLIVPGWLMVVSKDHARCVLGHSREELVELSWLISFVRNIVEKYYGPTVAFEHGHGVTVIVHVQNKVLAHNGQSNSQQRGSSPAAFRLRSRCPLSAEFDRI